MEINKSELMKNAWGMAKFAAYEHGGKPVEYFATCLKQRWAFEKKIRAPKQAAPERVATETEVIRIKDWFVNKNFDISDLMTYQTAEKIETLQETEKAIFIKIIGSYGKSFTTWLPKSCIAA